MLLPKEYPTKHEYVLGIDPGANTGMALWSRKEGKLLKLVTPKNGPGLYKAIQEFHKEYGHSLLCRVEDSNLNNFTYGRNDTGNIAERKRKSRNVGHNQGTSMAIISFIESLGIPVERHRSSAAFRKNMPDFKNEDVFKRYTGYEGSTSQHARDAALLVFGR